MAAESIDDAKLKPVGLEPLAVTVSTAARITGLGVSTIWLMLKDGRLRGRSVGRRRLVEYASLKELVLPKVKSAA